VLEVFQRVIDYQATAAALSRDRNQRVVAVFGNVEATSNVEMDHSRLCKPTGNAHIEAFKSRLQHECLNASPFLPMVDALNSIDEWRVESDEQGLYGAIENQMSTDLTKFEHAASSYSLFGPENYSTPWLHVQENVKSSFPF